MAPRAQWKGYLKLSLVSCPVALYSAASASERISFHLINRDTGHRLKQQYVDSVSGDLVETEDRIKGYEIAKGEYIAIEPEELQEVAIESNHTIDIESFVPASEIDAVYLENRYFLAPDDKVAEEPFAVIREAMRQRDMVGLARVVLYGRERLLMLQPRGRGLMATTLRYAYEVKDDSAYFDDIPKVDLPKEMLELASHIIDTKKAKFDPSKFEDRYQDAVVDLIKAKQAGRPMPKPAAQKPSNVVNLMDALRRSVAQAEGDGAPAKAGKSPRPTARRAPAKKAAAKKTGAQGTKARRKAG